MTAGKELSRAAAAAATLSGSGPLGLDDVVRPAALVARLRDPSDPVGTYLRARFTVDGQTHVAGYDGSDPPPLELQQAVVDELNRLLASDGDLWSNNAFKNVRMREEVRKRLKRPAAAADRAWTNRFRLELVLPELQQRPVNQLEQAGAELFTARYRPIYADAIARHMSRLESLGGLDADTRDRLWEPVLVGAHHTAILEVQTAAIRRRLNAGGLGAAGAMLLVMPWLAWRLGGKPPVSGSVDQVMLYLLVTIIELVLIGGLVAFGSWLSTRLLLLRVHNTRYYAIAFVSWPGLVMAYSVFQVRALLKLGTLHAVVEAAGLMAADGLWLVLLAWIAAREAGAWGLARWFEEDHPDVLIVDGLLTCLTILDGGRDDFRLLDTRQRLANQLERMATCIERVFPRRFEGRTTADPWVPQTAREMAFALRKLKRWTATPHLDTAEHLLARLRTDLVHAATGAWGHFERCPEEPSVPTSRARSVRQLAVGGLRTAVIAVLPLVGVWGAGAYGLGEPLRTQLLVSAGAWAVLTILLYLDPNSSRQLAALRDALPHGKGKD